MKNMCLNNKVFYKKTNAKNFRLGIKGILLKNQCQKIFDLGETVGGSVVHVIF